MTKQLKLGTLMIALAASAGAFANGYTVDKETTDVVRNSYGECWENNYLNKEVDGLVACGDKAAPVAEAPQAPVAQWVTYTLTEKEGFFFKLSSAEMTPRSREILDGVVADIKKANPAQVLVEGHTDYTGSEKYNQALSEKRANAVAKYFADNGVQAELSTVGYGETQQRLQAQCDAEVAKLAKSKRRAALIACLEPDRRVEIKFDRSVQKRVQ